MRYVIRSKNEVFPRVYKKSRKPAYSVSEHTRVFPPEDTQGRSATNRLVARSPLRSHQTPVDAQDSRV